MIKLCLKSGVYTLIDTEDYFKIMFMPWRLVSGYAMTGGPGKEKYLHRFLMNAKQGEEVDHEDGDKLNNQRYNLRLCTPQQNHCNRKLNKTSISGYKGVRVVPCNGRWQATIRCRGKYIHIGTFDTAEIAARAYDKWAIELFGEFARLNFPPSILE